MGKGLLPLLLFYCANLYFTHRFNMGKICNFYNKYVINPKKILDRSKGCC